MPKLIRIGNYVVFFWSNENNEPIHVHVSRGTISPNSTKIWLTKSGGAVVGKKSRIPNKDLNEVVDVIIDNHAYICSRWKEYFGKTKLKFYC